MDSEELLGLLEIIGFFVVWFGVGFGLSFPFTALVKKHPKLYTPLNLLITLYPYGYMLTILAVFLIDEDAGILPFIVFLVLHPIIWASLIMDFRVRKSVNCKTVSTLSMVNKLVHIPAYIFHFVMGLFGSLLSVWGIGFVLFAIIIDLITIAISGTFSLIATISLYKQKKITLPVAIAASIASYIYCIDLVAVIVVKIMVSNAEKTTHTSIDTQL